MNLKQIRQLLREGSQVVLVEEGQPPLVVRELRSEEPPEIVPIASRWPKIPPIAPRGRSILEGRPIAGSEIPTTGRDKQDQILDRLNKEILALKEQITQDEDAANESN